MNRDDNNSEELSRREWVLRLGEFVALAGISGVVPEAATELLAMESTLPVGVHLLSGNHLIQTQATASKNENKSSSFQPRFFSNEDFRIITRLVEIVLGQVDSGTLSEAARWIDLWFYSGPGIRAAARSLDPLHRALAVAYYGEDSVRRLETDDPQTLARDGIGMLHHFSVEKYGRGFLEMSAAQQIELVSSKAMQSESALGKFFEMARREAIRGYYTSADGIKDLNYQGNSYYRECPGCEVGARSLEPGIRSRCERTGDL